MNEPQPNGFVPAFLFTAGIVGGLAGLSTLGGLSRYGEISAWYFLWPLGVLAVVVAPFFALAIFEGRPGARAGVVAGVAVGLLALTVTCFVNLRAL